MIFVPNEENDPRINLAIETFLLKNKLIDEPILLFYINQPSIIIGKNQNTIEEINQTYVDANHIHVVRRLSGGGAVYHDFGNLNFSFIMPNDGESFRNFAKFTQPIINALHELGVTGAQLKGRNDLVIDDKKFSGNAVYAANGKMFAHGTILFDSNIDEVVNALNVKPEKIASKGIKSIRSRVTNIKPYLPAQYQSMDTKAFRDALLLKIFNVTTISEIKTYQLTAQDRQHIDAISDEYYRNWDWNYGKSPEFELIRQQRFPIGSIEIKLNVDKGIIKDIRIFGDFFGQGEIKDIEQLLQGHQYEKQHLSHLLEDINLQQYFGDITKEEFLTLII